MRHVKITIEFNEGDKPGRSAVYDTRDQLVRISGSLYPKDLLLVTRLVGKVKYEQKHGLPRGSFDDGET